MLGSDLVIVGLKGKCAGPLVLKALPFYFLLLCACQKQEVAIGSLVSAL